jgi:hypothetical protein
MADPQSRDELGRRRLVTVVLRLVLDRDGLVVRGEILDNSSRPSGRFAGWDRLVPALRAWVEEASVEEE